MYMYSILKIETKNRQAINVELVHDTKGKFGQIWRQIYIWNKRGHTHQNWCASTPTCMIFWANSNWLNFSTTMDLYM